MNARLFFGSFRVQLNDINLMEWATSEVAAAAAAVAASKTNTTGWSGLMYKSIVNVSIM